MNNSRDAETALRQVLESQLRIRDLGYEDDLNQMDPDFPTDEVIRDVLEQFGHHGQKPMYTRWSGTFGELIKIVDAQLERLSESKR